MSNLIESRSQNPNTLHIPILVEPIVSSLLEPFQKLPPQAEPHYLLDCTLGGGGHCASFLEAFSSHPELQKHRILALDQDPEAIRKAETRFQKEIAADKLRIFHQRFGEAEEILKSYPVLGILADLGFSSDQLENATRGLSFQSEGPLDMRLDPTQGISCQELLQTLSQPELEKILEEYGEERFSKRIASAVVWHRMRGHLPATPKELAELVIRALPPKARHGRIHAATRTFQALRIAVNSELTELDHLLDHVILRVKPGGRIAIISFHSLEDRKVKMKFKDQKNFLALTRKPIQADEDEIRRNPRSRSAKLRIAERLDTASASSLSLLSKKARSKC